jgi:hypothetical protein
MATLFDKLSQTTNQLPENNQSRIETLLAAKKGKTAAAPTGQSNIGEQVQQSQNAGALQQGAMTTAIEGMGQNVQRQGLENKIQEAGQAQQQQFDLARQTATAEQARNLGTLAGQESLQNQELDAAKQRKLQGISAQSESSLRNLAAQSQMEVDDIFANFERSDKELAFRRDGAQLEQLGTLLALQDRKYTDELNRIGESRKLYDQKSWNEEKARIIYGSNLDALMNDLNFKRGEDITNRAFQDQLSQISIDQALAMADAAMKDSQQKAMWQAGTSAATTAAGTDWSQFKTPETTTGSSGPLSPEMAADVFSPTGAGQFDVTK